MVYLGNTFSPQMLNNDSVATVHRIGFDDALNLLSSGFTSVVSHDITANILSGILGVPVAFNRVNLKMNPGDILIAIIPNFRADTAREFTADEVRAGFSFFKVVVS